MKHYLYLTTAIIGTMLVKAGNVQAQDCIQSRDCTTLGYTETSCVNGGIKCPFGEKWACYTKSVSDKLKNCTLGALYYSDDTCSSDKLTNKTVLGVVIYADGNGGGWIIALEPTKGEIGWSKERRDIPNLPNYTSVPTDLKESCDNTDIITAYGSSSYYPPAWAAKNYNPYGTPAGKRWCLPSAGLLDTLNNDVNFNKVNAGLTIAEGKTLGNIYSAYGYYYETIWSSSEYSDSIAWYLATNNQGMHSTFRADKVDTDYYTSVRPVMEF